MRYEDITPHLNKIATLYLKNNKRKVGWLFLERMDRTPSDPVSEVYFVNVQKGRRLIHTVNTHESSSLLPVRETIHIHDIVRIRSSK